MTDRIGDLKTLGLPPDANWDDVKAAFRRLARKHHPDVTGPEGAGKFVEITEAYMALKECLACAGAHASRERTPQRRRAEAAVESKSLWKRFVDKFFSGGGEKPRDYPFDIPPARIRFIDSSISRAESQIMALLQRRGETKAKNRTDALISRLCCKHPAVALLALRSITANDRLDEIRAAAVEHFSGNVPASEILEPLLSLFASTKETRDFAKAVSAHAHKFSTHDALTVMRWLKRYSAEKECFAPFLGHSSASVAVFALNNWGLSFGLPDTSDLSKLFKTDDEAVLMALLRLLKRERAPDWTLLRISRISRDHESPAVRVWASAIVRDKNLG